MFQECKVSAPQLAGKASSLIGKETLKKRIYPLKFDSAAFDRLKAELLVADCGALVFE
jgi:hypothetical protein